MVVKVSKKVAEVMKRVDYLQKDRQVAYKSTRYSYLSEEKITTEIRKAMLEVGLVIYPVRMEVVNRSERMVSILITYRIQDVDSEGFIEIQALGEGMDAGDKAVYKAMTGAFKYAQRQAFMIPTGDDPDKSSSDELLEDWEGNGAVESDGEAGKKPSPSPAGKSQRATPRQLNMIYALANETSMSSEAMKLYMKDFFGKESSRELTRKEASEMIDMLQKEKAS